MADFIEPMIKIIGSTGDILSNDLSEMEGSLRDLGGNADQIISAYGVIAMVAAGRLARAIRLKDPNLASDDIKHRTIADIAFRLNNHMDVDE